MTTVNNTSNMFSDLMTTRKNETKDNAQKLELDENIRVPNQDLGKDQFMQLLATQLKHQDPSSPMDNTDFIAQLATFSSLEQMQNMSEELTDLKGLLELYMGFQINHNSSVGIAQSADLIGKEITATIKGEVEGENGDGTKGETEDGEITGRVESIIVRGAIMYAKVGDDEIPLDQITAIK